MEMQKEIAVFMVVERSSKAAVQGPSLIGTAAKPKGPNTKIENTNNKLK
jgi:hypothetical protein